MSWMALIPFGGLSHQIQVIYTPVVIGASDGLIILCYTFWVQLYNLNYTFGRGITRAIQLPVLWSPAPLYEQVKGFYFPLNSCSYCNY
jgi:hypothetical protein